MASERSTDVQAFIGELDGGVFETKIGAVLSEVASGVMNTKTKGKVSLNLEIEPFDENRVKIKHKLSYVRPTNRGKISEEDGVTGKFGLGIRNEAGQRLIEFCQENARVIANTF